MNFSWTSPHLETKPQWQVVNPGESWSLTESLLTPGLDAVTNVTEPSRRPPQQSRNRCSLSSPRPGRACTGKHNGGKPQSTSTGQATVNAYQMMTGPHPVYRMSQASSAQAPRSACRRLSLGAETDLPFESVTKRRSTQQQMSMTTASQTTQARSSTTQSCHALKRTAGR